MVHTFAAIIIIVVVVAMSIVDSRVLGGAARRGATALQMMRFKFVTECGNFMAYFEWPAS